jgi:hypothetical protein
MKCRILSLAALALATTAAAGVPDKCQVSILDMAPNSPGSSQAIGTFDATVGEEELTTRSYKIPGIQQTVTASVFYTDESIGIEYGDSSAILGLSVGKKAVKNAIEAKDASLGEADISSQFGLVKIRIAKRIQSDGKDLSIQLECKEQKQDNADNTDAAMIPLLQDQP